MDWCGSKLKILVGGRRDSGTSSCHLPASVAGVGVDGDADADL